MIVIIVYVNIELTLLKIAFQVKGKILNGNKQKSRNIKRNINHNVMMA